MRRGKKKRDGERKRGRKARERGDTECGKRERVGGRGKKRKRAGKREKE